MKITLLAQNQEVETFNKEDAKTFSGKNAGICYGEHGYYNTAVSDPAKAFKRFSKVADTGHHSIADHVRVTVLFEDTPKIVAMVLNSLGDYATSEKSGRYTKMEGCSEKELTLYRKWVGLFKKAISRQYPGMFDEKHAEKLAMENARYLLSVFTPTTFSYTTSVRQFNYIMDWCDKFAHTNMERNYFNDMLRAALSDAADKLGFLFVEELRDYKDRDFGFLPVQTSGIMAEFDESDKNFSYSYQTCYHGTFAQLAQAQRHRTLEYFCIFNGEVKEKDENAFYVPKIIRDDDTLKAEWFRDIRSVSELIPQGTMVKIVETGTAEAFILKCKERLCGRAQLEIAVQTEKTLIEMYNNAGGKPALQSMLGGCLTSAGVKAKCQLLGGCKEPCVFGASNAVRRKI